MKNQKTQMIDNLVYYHAPLGIYQLDGDSIQVYDNPKDAYLDVLQRLNREFPKGYMDIAWFACEHQHISLRQAERNCINGEYFYIRLFDIENKERVEKMRLVLSILLKATGCKFDENSFKAALYEFDKLQIQSTVEKAVDSDNSYKFKG